MGCYDGHVFTATARLTVDGISVSFPRRITKLATAISVLDAVYDKESDTVIVFASSYAKDNTIIRSAGRISTISETLICDYSTSTVSGVPPDTDITAVAHDSQSGAFFIGTKTGTIYRYSHATDTSVRLETGLTLIVTHLQPAGGFVYSLSMGGSLRKDSIQIANVMAHTLCVTENYVLAGGLMLNVFRVDSDKQCVLDSGSAAALTLPGPASLILHLGTYDSLHEASERSGTADSWKRFAQATADALAATDKILGGSSQGASPDVLMVDYSNPPSARLVEAFLVGTVWGHLYKVLVYENPHKKSLHALISDEIPIDLDDVRLLWLTAGSLRSEDRNCSYILVQDEHMRFSMCTDCL